MPLQEFGDHGLGLRPLAGAVPGTAEVQVLPQLVDPLGDLTVVGAFGRKRSGSVNDDAQMLRYSRRAHPDRGLQQPAKAAPGKRLDS